jgi:hypothetical protein
MEVDIETSKPSSQGWGWGTYSKYVLDSLAMDHCIDNDVGDDERAELEDAEVQTFLRWTAATTFGYPDKELFEESNYDLEFDDTQIEDPGGQGESESDDQ